MNAPQNLAQEQLRMLTRRQFFGRCATGIGTLALTSLLNERFFALNAVRAENRVAPQRPHFRARPSRHLSPMPAPGAARHV